MKTYKIDFFLYFFFIISVEAGLFQNLPNLLVLNVNRAGLSILPDLTANLNLQQLHISNNSLVTLDPVKLFGNPPDYSKVMQLTVLSAAHNRITSVERDLVASLTNLEILNLGFNQLTNFPLDSLVNSVNLEYLSLESNQIETLVDWGISGRTNLNIDITGTCQRFKMNKNNNKSFCFGYHTPVSNI